MLTISRAIRPSFLFNTKTKYLPSLLYKQCHTKNADKADPQKNTFTMVYKFSHIASCSIINRVKKYQLICFGAGIPTVFGLQALEICDQTAIFVFSYVGLATTVAIFTAGQFITNLVGITYINEDKTKIKIAYVDFWGARRDKIDDISNVIGITKSSFLPWGHLKLKDDPINYKINFRYGEIFSTPLFQHSLKYDPDVPDK